MTLDYDDDADVLYITVRGPIEVGIISRRPLPKQRRQRQRLTNSISGQPESSSK